MAETPLTSKRFTLVEKEDYGVDLEYTVDFAILHFPYVYKFSKGILLDMYSTIESLKGFLADMGYEHIWVAIPPEKESTAKLVQRFGFEYKGSDQGLDVYMLEGID